MPAKQEPTPQQQLPQGDGRDVEPSRNLPTITAGRRVRAIIPAKSAEIRSLALVAFQSGLVPYGFKNWQAVAVAMMHGAEIGLPPMQSLRSIAVINGRPTLWGDAGIALVRESGLMVKWKEWFSGNPYEDTFSAHCSLTREGEDEMTYEFSVADAKRAMLWDKRSERGGPTPWVTYPKRMMMWRARILFRDVFPDVLGGFRFREEAQDDILTIDAEPVVSGLADRLPGPAKTGFRQGHVDRELAGQQDLPLPVTEAVAGSVVEEFMEREEPNGGSHEEPPQSPVEASEPVPATPPPPEPGNAPTPVPTQAAAIIPVPSEDERYFQILEDEQEMLEDFNNNMTTAPTMAEVMAVEEVFAPLLAEGSLIMRAVALDLVVAHRNRVSKNKSRRKTT
jgi:hypothetical protein